MTDEIPFSDAPKPEEQPAAIVPEVIPPDSPKEKYLPKSSTLDLIPDNMKKDLHELIAKGYGGLRVKKVMDDRYAGKSEFLPKSKETYELYIAVHKDEIMKMSEAQKNLVEATKDSLSDMKDMLDASTEQVSLEDKKGVLAKLFNRCEARIKIIEAFNSGYITPQFEQVIGAYIREQRAILETLVKLQAEFVKEAEEDTYKEFENLAYVWVVTALNVYKKLKGEDKFLEFQSALKEELQKATEMYITRLKQEKK